MGDLGRLLPERFAQTYWDAFGALPPDAFLEAYEALCDVLYNGGPRPEPGEEGKRGKQFHTGYHFKGGQVVRFKAAVDLRLAAIREALWTWTEERAHPRARRPRPDRHQRGDLAPSRSTGARGPGQE